MLHHLFHLYSCAVFFRLLVKGHRVCIIATPFVGLWWVLLSKDNDMHNGIIS